ncbi:hypothetical protein AVEN_103344-1 [Araneus ventricosus]|uniref:Uncharacterized protein n=1 Tax=Araneus ventricosus TaxID=182803 RepID=A0A4Y2KA63_ARAVE|nr:hypothetical protein AVEN_103344-1 [Araneus ventricosus]
MKLLMDIEYLCLKNKVERICNVIFCDEIPYKPLTVEITGCRDMCHVEENGSTQVSDEVTLTGIEAPACFSEALMSPKSKLREEAMMKEEQSHEENGTIGAYRTFRKSTDT